MLVPRKSFQTKWMLETNKLNNKRKYLKKEIIKEIKRLKITNEQLAEKLGLLYTGVLVLLDEEWSLDDIFVICEVLNFSLEVFFLRSPVHE